MFLDAINHQTPIDRFRVLETKLDAMGRDISVFRKKTAPLIRETINVLEQRINEKRFQTGFMEFMKDENYIKDIYTRDALACLLEYKSDRDASTQLIPGMTYYMARRNGNNIVGKRCHYIMEDKAYWSPVNEDVRIMKAKEVMQWGTTDNFRKIYFELADGRLFESTQETMLEHLTESSDSALDDIESYCDSLWEGAWPWELATPMKLQNIIKENTEMTKRSVQEFRSEFKDIIRNLNEGEIEKSAVITKMQGYIDDIDGMLEKLARTSGNLLTDVRETVRAEFGDGAADRIDSLVQDKIKGAADNLSELKSQWAQELESIINPSDENAEFDAMDEPEEPEEMPSDDISEPDEIEGDLDISDDEIGDIELDNPERDKK